MNDEISDLNKKLKEHVQATGYNLVEGVPEDVLIQKAPHYNKGGIECIEAAEAMLTKEELIGAYRFQVLKYIWRLWEKDKALTNAKKAMYYLERIILLLS